MKQHSGGYFTLEAYDENGVLQWQRKAANKIVNTGLTHIRDVLFGSPKTQTYPIGLIGVITSIVAADTMASHAGWSEVTAYSEGTRPVWNKVAGGAGVLTNSASVATYTISGTTTVGGVFVVTDSLTKGSTTGTLISAAALTGGNAALQNGWTLKITYTLTLTSAA